MGLCALLSLGPQFWSISTTFDLLLFCTLSGLIGSGIDSILGAMFQYSGIDQRTMKVTNEPNLHAVHISGYPILSNNAVNVLTSVLTSFAVMPKLAVYLKLFNESHTF